MIKPLSNETEYSQVLAASSDKPVFIFKHSTACPVSARAWKTFNSFAENDSRADYYRVLVIEDRPLAQHIAQATGIRHESPQVILFRNGAPVWDESHWSIAEEALSEALANGS